jgi:hypothetical protein
MDSYGFPRQARDRQATAALVVSVVAILVSPFYWPVGVALGLAAVALGLASRSELSRHHRAGEGQARTAVTCGVIALVICASSILTQALTS